MRIKRYLIALLIVIAFALPFLAPAIAYAIIDQPDSAPVISDVHVNRNLITSGDICIYGQYYIPYGTPPDDLASSAFVFRLMDTDNTTQLGAITPFAYFYSGFNWGVFSFYSTNLTWGTQYVIRLSEKPSAFTSPTSWNYVMSLTDYSDETTQSANQLEMAANVLNMANDLASHYTTYTLTESAAGGTVLAAPSGETYFRGAIPGIDYMAPSLFIVSTIIIDTSSTNWTTAQADNYTARFETTWIGAAQNATATQFGLTGPMIMAMVTVLPLSIGSIVLSNKRFRKAEPGFIAALVLVIWGFMMGWLPAAVFATIYQLCGMYIAYLWFYSRG